MSYECESPSQKRSLDAIFVDGVPDDRNVMMIYQVCKIDIQCI